MLDTETIVDLNEAAKRLPALGTGRKKKRPHVSTLWRWARRGVMGHRLEVRRLGRRIVTSMEAIERFSKALGEAPLPERPRRRSAAAKGRTGRAREAAIKQAESRLREAGI